MNLMNWGTTTTQAAGSSLSPKLLTPRLWAVVLSMPRLEKAQSGACSQLDSSQDTALLREMSVYFGG